MHLKKLYNKLNIIANELGVKIIHGKGNFKGGSCVIKEESVIVINSNKPFEDRIKNLALGLLEFDLSSIEIDSLNILRASHLAMQRAVAAMSFIPVCIYVDGHLVPEFDVPAFSVIKGDDRVDVISAGAIIAKVERDRIMSELDILHPGFGWSQNKGYPTKAHLRALVKTGPVADHRMTFKPVKDNLTVGVRSTKRSS